MTKQEQLRYEYFIETGIVWIDTNDNIEMDYLKWVENKALTIPLVVGRSEQLKALLETLLNENMCSVVGDELIEEALKGF